MVCAAKIRPPELKPSKGQVDLVRLSCCNCVVKHSMGRSIHANLVAGKTAGEMPCLTIYFVNLHPYTILPHMSKAKLVFHKVAYNVACC